MKGALRHIKHKVDPNEYGGAPLLGVKGVSIVSHGGSNAHAIKNAIRVASSLVKDNINLHIHSQLREISQHIILA
jgi:glycerol-3-phosphate acyltransferase PlsX